MITLLEKTTGQGIDAYLATKGLPAKMPFADTNDAAIAAAYVLGILNGTPATTFSPNGSITRQESAAMLSRTAKVLGLTAGKRGLAVEVIYMESAHHSNANLLYAEGGHKRYYGIAKTLFAYVVQVSLDTGFDGVRPAEAVRHVRTEETEGRERCSDVQPAEQDLSAVRQEDVHPRLRERLRGSAGGVRAVLYDDAAVRQYQSEAYLRFGGKPGRVHGPGSSGYPEL